MATLEKIRKKGPLVAVIIGIALVSFILGDFLSSGKSMFTDSQNEMAKVFDKSISYNDYFEQTERLRQIYINNQGGKTTIDAETEESIRKQIWDEIIKSAVMEQSYNELGLGIHPEELFELTQGQNLHPIVQQIFQNKETGQVDRAQIINFLKNMDNEEAIDSKNYWLFLEEQIVTSQVFSKYMNLVKKGMYATSYEGKTALEEKNLEANFDFIVQKYNAISDSAISFSEQDVQSYYDIHNKKYEQEASRDIAYVTFDVIASEMDDKNAREALNKLIPEFKASDNDMQFVNLSSDEPYDETNYKQGILPEMLDTFAFSSEIGDMYGPYKENNSYKIAKLSAINYLPDSLKASHILIKVETQEDYNTAHALIDSLKLLIENGADFSELAKKHSVDGSAPNGGDLGWFKEKQMVKPFNDWCFEAKVGDLGIVDSQFGVHLIKLTDRGKEVKKVQVGIVEIKVIAGTKTYRDIYAKANTFAGQNRTLESFESAIVSENLTKRLAPNLNKAEKKIAGLDRPDILINWAYRANLNEVSTVFDFSDKFVVAVLTGVREKGIAPLEQVRQQVEAEVIKNKKADKIIAMLNAEISENKTLEQIASKIEAKVEKAESINFSSFQVPGAGIEPELIAAVLNSEENKISTPVKGTNGVYVYMVTSLNKKEGGDYLAEEKRLTASAQSRAEYQTYEAMKKLANIVDNR